MNEAVLARRATADDVGRLKTALAAAFEDDPVFGWEPHHYLPYIGVAPEAQGRGLGSALMRPILDRCDEERLPAYLEATSERNAALYERLGFELRAGGSPPLWLMVRPPGGAAE